MECNTAIGCTCKQGWQGATCSDDINECVAGTDDCGANSTCANNEGGYTCVCDIGFISDSGCKGENRKSR